MARVASFAPEQSEGINDGARDTYKLYARQTSGDYHHYQYARPSGTNFFDCLVTFRHPSLPRRAK